MKGRVLAVDYGSRRLGVAVSDPLRMLARERATLSNDTTVLDSLLEIIHSDEVTLILVGMPYAPDGGMGRAGQEVQRFIDRLSERISGPLERNREQGTGDKNSQQRTRSTSSKFIRIVPSRPMKRSSLSSGIEIRSTGAQRRMDTISFFRIMYIKNAAIRRIIDTTVCISSVDCRRFKLGTGYLECKSCYTRIRSCSSTS